MSIVKRNPRFTRYAHLGFNQHKFKSYQHADSLFTRTVEPSLSVLEETSVASLEGSAPVTMSPLTISLLELSSGDAVVSETLAGEGRTLPFGRASLLPPGGVVLRSE